MPADFADIYNPGYGEHAEIKGSGTEAVITNWVDPRSKLEWMFQTSEPGKYRVEVLVKANEKAELSLDLNGKMQKAVITPTLDRFDVVRLGEIEIKETGDQVITLTPDPEMWNHVELMYLELIKL